MTTRIVYATKSAFKRHELEEWTKHWTRLHRSFDAPALTPALADQAAERVVALIRGMEPIIDQMELRR